MSILHTPFIEELSSNLDVWDTALRVSHLPHLLVLESSDRNPERGRYSFITADPFRFNQTRIESNPSNDPFLEIQELLLQNRCEPVPDLPPFQGGLAGLFGYGLAHSIERLPRNHWDEFHVPDLAVGLYDWVIAFDHLKNRVWIISTGLHARNSMNWKSSAKERIDFIQALLRNPIAKIETPDQSFRESISPDRLAPQYPLDFHPKITSNFSREQYLAVVDRAIEYIHAGDCFQVNLSQRLLAPAQISPFELYERIRKRNRSPFGGYFDLGDFVLVSASPERFIRVQDGLVETRPIKGTRPRGSTPSEDQKLIDELRNSPKDRAENVMIVDLLRNDLGRVCEYGSIQVSKVCEVESFPFVHHLVSEVRGTLRVGSTPIDLLRAAFPGGSITGAPKVRAMEIITELEPTARGPYCGCLGYVGFDGTMDTNILIRTFTVGRGWIQFPVGGGIVADSDSMREYEETLHKAAGLLKVLES